MRKTPELDQQVQAAQARLQQIQEAAIARGEENPLLATAIVELSIALEELGVTTEELRQQNEELLVTQQLLAAERQHYQNLFEFAPDAYVVTDGKGVIRAINGAAENLLNIRGDYAANKPLIVFIAAGHHPLIYAQLDYTHQDYAHQDRTPAPRAAKSSRQRSVAKALQDSQGHAFPVQGMPVLQDQEIAVQPREGEPIPVAMSLSVVRDRQGYVLCLYWLFHDLRPRKQAAMALQASEERYRLMFDKHPKPMWFYDPQTLAFLEVNRAAIAHYGYSRDEFLQMTVADIRPPEDIPSLQQVVQQIKLGEVHFGVWQHRKKDGTVIDVEVTSYEVPVSGQPTYLALIRDITDFKRSERARQQLALALEASENKLNRILNSAIVAIASFRIYADYTWEYEYWSAGCEQLFGYTLDEYTDKNFWLSQVISEDREQVIMPLFLDFFAEKDVTAEYRFRRKDGSIRWFSSSYNSQKICEDCWIVTTVNYDITDRKQAELALQKQIRQEYILADMAQDIRRSLNLKEVLSRTVHRVREFLQSDRAIIFRFRPNGEGTVIMESATAECPSILGTELTEACFRQYCADIYQQGQKC